MRSTGSSGQLTCRVHVGVVGRDGVDSGAAGALSDAACPPMQSPVPQLLQSHRPTRDDPRSCVGCSQDRNTNLNRNPAPSAVAQSSKNWSNLGFDVGAANRSLRLVGRTTLPLRLHRGRLDQKSSLHTAAPRPSHALTCSPSWDLPLHAGAAPFALAAAVCHKLHLALRRSRHDPATCT